MPVAQKDSFHLVTVGMVPSVVANLWDPIVGRCTRRISHIAHPAFDRSTWDGAATRRDTVFFREALRVQMPKPDLGLLQSLEQDGVPTIHNMIMGDRIVSKLDYEEALGYATFVARRLGELYRLLEPSAVIAGFDALHGSLSCAVAKRMQIPWFALHFSVIPPGLACLCDRPSPAARVVLWKRPVQELRTLAAEALQQFEKRSIRAPVYIAPPPLPLLNRILKLPVRTLSLYRILRNARSRKFLQFTQERRTYSLPRMLQSLRRATTARLAMSKIRSLTQPPAMPYVLFGLHLQPESSIDVWAPFFSNQMWVIELLARAIPPTHKLLVKIHRSDIANYSRAQLEQMSALPGVDLVAPFADARDFIERAQLLVLIQGTMGLEGALLGKPVIMLGDSPFTLFPSASAVGELADLPDLVRKKLVQSPPDRGAIVDAYANYLAPFFPASPNNWTVARSAQEIDGYVGMVEGLKRYVESDFAASRRAVP